MGTFLAIAGFLLAWLTYHKTFVSPDITEESNNLLGVFITTQKLHLEVQGLLQKYIEEKNESSIV